MGININGAFLREELVDGSIGLNYPEKTREVFAELTDEQFETIISEELNAPDTPINGLLDRIVTTLADRITSMIEPNSKGIVFEAYIFSGPGMEEWVHLKTKNNTWVPSELDVTKALEIAEIEQGSDLNLELPTLITEPREDVYALFRSNTSDVPEALRTTYFDGELLTAGIWIQNFEIEAEIE